MGLRTRILLVDDVAVVRTSIRSFLEPHSFQICGEATDGKEAIEKVRALKPDIVVMDINMPVMNGIQAACEIRRIAPATRIVFLTAHAIPILVQNIGPWSDGFVSKARAGRELIPLLSRLAVTLQNEPRATD
jgi:two-component system, NarL family, nitrate/nitrite response regulator NarL